MTADHESSGASRLGHIWARFLGLVVVAGSVFFVVQNWEPVSGPLHWKNQLVCAGVFELLLLVAVVLDRPGRSVVRAAREHHHHGLSPMFSTIWGLWVGGVLLYEILSPSPFGKAEMAVASSVWTLFLFAFLAFELTAVVLPSEGDTLSETVWRFLHDEPSRGIMAMGFAWLLLIRVIEIGQPAQIRLSWLDDASLGRILLASGVGGWLTFHWAVAEWKRVRRDTR